MDHEIVNLLKWKFLLEIYVFESVPCGGVRKCFLQVFCCSVKHLFGRTQRKKKVSTIIKGWTVKQQKKVVLTDSLTLSHSGHHDLAILCTGDARWKRKDLMMWYALTLPSSLCGGCLIACLTVWMRVSVGNTLTALTSSTNKSWSSQATRFICPYKCHNKNI